MRKLPLSGPVLWTFVSIYLNKPQADHSRFFPIKGKYSMDPSVLFESTNERIRGRSEYCFALLTRISSAIASSETTTKLVPNIFTRYIGPYTSAHSFNLNHMNWIGRSCMRPTQGIIHGPGNPSGLCLAVHLEMACWIEYSINPRTTIAAAEIVNECMVTGGTKRVDDGRRCKCDWHE